MIFWALYFCHTSFLYRIAAVCTKKLWDPQGAMCSSKEVLLLWEVTLSRYVPVSLCGSCGVNCINGLLFRAQFNNVPIFGVCLCDIAFIFYGAIFHKQTPKEVFLMDFCLLLY